MNNLQFALSLALLNNERFVVHTNDYEVISRAIQGFVDASEMSFGEVDLALVPIDKLVLQVTSGDKLKNVILLRNLATTSAEYQRQLVHFFDEIDEFDSNHCRFHPKEHITVSGREIARGEFQCFIAILDDSRVPINKRLKEKFWFSQYHLVNGFEDMPPIPQYTKLLLIVKQELVFQSPEMTGYIYSLITHIRNHRLMTMSQIQSRLRTDVIDKVTLLAKSIVAWKNRNLIANNRNTKEPLFVTPEFCKIAIRKVAYWLVEWQIKGHLFDDLDNQETNIEDRRRIMINMLAGEWYGSEYPHVRNYLVDYVPKHEPSSNTGFSNRIVEDSIKLVRPPI